MNQVREPGSVRLLREHLDDGHARGAAGTGDDGGIGAGVQREEQGRLERAGGREARA